MKSSSSAATKKEKRNIFCFFRHASLLNRSNSNRIDAKETAAVVAETEKEETVAGTSLRFSTDVGSSISTQQQHVVWPRCMERDARFGAGLESSFSSFGETSLVVLTHRCQMGNGGEAAEGA